ncbi:MAG: hypothetical protein NW203_02730 [Hyphomonadaceae bacterium]|nr:hypothetical protein [Hyphomonadaceae bacterium]
MIMRVLVILALALAGCARTPEAPAPEPEGPPAATSFFCEDATARSILVGGAVGEDGALTLREFAIADGAFKPDQRILSEAVQRSGDAAAASATVSAVQLGERTAACATDPAARFAGFTARAIVVVTEPSPRVARMRITPFDGGPPIEAMGAIEIGGASLTFTADIGADRYILYAPQTVRATLSLWRGGAKVETETLLAQHSVLAPEGD